MTHKRKRLFAFALVMCLLFGLLPGTSQAEQTQTPPVADAHAAETPLDAVPATQTPTELTEAETVSLSKDEVRVIKGGTTTLTAEIPEAERGESPLATSSAIVWSSSNPAVATVDSNGVVTGIELGEATITATLNGTVIETFTAYSTLATGYYVLESYSALFTLAASSTSMEDGTGMEFLSYEYEEESLQTVIGDVWYIKNVGGTYYSIHPAFSRGMAIALPNSDTVALYRTTNLTAHKWHWQIESVSGGYIFRNRYYTNTTFAAGGEDDNYYIETATINTSNSSQRWDYFSPILVPGQPVVA